MSDCVTWLLIGWKHGVNPVPNSSRGLSIHNLVFGEMRNRLIDPVSNLQISTGKRSKNGSILEVNGRRYTDSLLRKQGRHGRRFARFTAAILCAFMKITITALDVNVMVM